MNTKPKLADCGHKEIPLKIFNLPFIFKGRLVKNMVCQSCFMRKTKGNTTYRDELNSEEVYKFENNNKWKIKKFEELLHKFEGGKNENTNKR